MRKFIVFQKHLKPLLLSIVLSSLIGIFIGFLLFTPKRATLQYLEGQSLRVSDQHYPLVNSLLGYDNAEATNFGQLISFKEKLSRLVNQEITEKNASQISVYFRDLNTGHWIGVNENETYTPASLLKVPVMLAYYHLSETNPGLLAQQIQFNGKDDIDNEQTIQPSQKLEPGKIYSVEKLMNEMIIYSDNDSLQLLFKHIDPTVLNKVFMDLDVLLPTNGGIQDFISVKNYALFFRVLYGATYLSHPNSEKALELLSRSQFKDGLVAGVSKDILVAHKFGEYSLIDPTTKVVTKREFHDCGIIYYPGRPYLLCVMTKDYNDNLVHLEKSVRDISKLVYNEVQQKDN